MHSPSKTEAERDSVQTLWTKKSAFPNLDVDLQAIDQNQTSNIFHSKWQVVIDTNPVDIKPPDNDDTRNRKVQ